MPLRLSSGEVQAEKAEVRDGGAGQAWVPGMASGPRSAASGTSKDHPPADNRQVERIRTKLAMVFYQLKSNAIRTFIAQGAGRGLREKEHEIPQARSVAKTDLPVERGLAWNPGHYDLSPGSTRAKST